MLVSQPPIAIPILRAYKPEIFTAMYPEPTGNVPPIAEVSVFINGTQIGESLRIAYTRFTQLAGIRYYFFDINISERMREFFNNEAPFAGLNTASFTQFAGGILYITVRKWAQNANGLLVPTVTLDTSNTYYILNAQFNQVYSQERFNAFYNTTFYGTTRLLTNKPYSESICLQDSAFISLLGFYSGNAIEVRTYNSNNVQTGIDYINTGFSISSNLVKRYGVGPANINAVTTWVGAGLTIGNDVHKYTVQTGHRIGGIFLRGCIAKTFFVGCGCEMFRLHYLNEYGADDTMTIDNYTHSLNVESETFERQLSIKPISSANRGINNVQPVAQDEYSFVAAALNKSDLTWVRELAITPNAFLQLPGSNKYIACYIVPSSVAMFDSDSQRTNVKLTIKLSQKQYAQTN